MQKGVLWTVVLLWGLLIWSFSSQDAADSTHISRGVAAEIVENTKPVIDKIVPEITKKASFNNTFHHLLRETAHVAIYFVLGVLVALLATQYSLRRPFFTPYLACVLFAFADELNQKFCTVGRSFQMIDLYKDWGGSLIGVFLVWMGYRLFMNRENSR